jgi:hypothetical protein
LVQYRPLPLLARASVARLAAPAAAANVHTVTSLDTSGAGSPRQAIGDRVVGGRAGAAVVGATTIRRPARPVLPAVLAAALGALGAALLPAPAGANTYTVTSTADAGAGTLRQAIASANGNPGPDAIHFALGGSGVRVIALASVLPSLLSDLTIDGTTQPGFTGAPIVRLDGGGLPANVHGLDVGGSSVTVKGLQIVRMSGPGIRVWGANFTLESSYLGTDGTADLGNELEGLVCQAGVGLEIGGPTASAGNVISGNDGNGIVLYQPCSGASVQSNRIGTNAGGTAAVGNALSGLYSDAANGVIGSATVVGAGNVISGNGLAGVRLGFTANGTLVAGNRIGTRASGTAAIPNASFGIDSGGSGNTIGGTASFGNLVSGNAGVGINLTVSATDNLVLGNRVGVNADGTAALANAAGIDVHAASVTIGGNLVSGNLGNGVTVRATAAGTVLTGNAIGVDLAGTAALGNGGHGVRILAAGTRVGGDEAPARNQISGNAGSGILVEAEATATLVLGNAIGTDAAGAAAIPNQTGVTLLGPGSTVGGALPGAGNLLSGNAGDGLVLGLAASDTEVLGNRIGTNAAGTAAVGNGGCGIRVVGGHHDTIGGEAAGAGNLVSGNGCGILVEAAAYDVAVRGNVIGLAASLAAKLPNGAAGVELRGSGNQVGGPAPGAGNVIAGNAGDGVALVGGAATGNVVQGNRIGTNPSGSAGLGNAGAGVGFAGGSGNQVGGAEAGAGNVIARNPVGVAVRYGSRNSVLGNSIHDNGLLGIDLDPPGPVANDPLDGDSGANGGQNFPVVTAAQQDGGNLALEGFLASRPHRAYRVELFSSAAIDGTGLGEAEHFLGAVEVTTDALGQAPFAAALPAFAGDLFVSATATDLAEASTSELAPAAAIGAPQAGRFQLALPVFNAYESAGPLVAAVVRTHGSTGTASVAVSHLDGTATAPEDFAAVAGTLTFGPGEVVRSISVPIVADGVPEGNEKWSLKLDDPSGGATLGAWSQVQVALHDGDPGAPFFAIADAAASEGDAGVTSLDFTITLSPTDHDVEVEWWTEDGTASAGDDYIATGGTVLFHPGEPQKLVQVSIEGDTLEEGDEVLHVHVASPDGVPWGQPAEGLIVDDDVPLDPDALFADGFEGATPEAWDTIEPQAP